MSSYSEMLKDPRWQKRRLKVLEAAEFACAACEATDKTLHVHHMYYQRGKKPWEYPDEALRCLCIDCHDRIGARQLRLSQIVSLLSEPALDMIIGYASALRSHDEDDLVLVLENAEVLAGVANLFGLSEQEVYAQMNRVTDEVYAAELWKLVDAKRAKSKVKDA